VDICKHFGTCGGCQLQDVPYIEQLTGKTDRLAGLLAHALTGSGVTIQPMIGMAVEPGEAPWRFRHKASFVFASGPRGRGLVMGHFAAGSKTVVPIDECPVHAGRANRIAFALRDELVRARITAAGPSLEGILRHLIVRTSADERQAVAMLVVTRNDKALRTPIRRFLGSAERPTGLLLNIHYKAGPFMVGKETIRLHGRTHVREDRLGTSFLVSPTAFFQTNPDQAVALVDAVVAGALADCAPGEDRFVLDLYSGSGLFALPLAMRGCTVTAVEENRQANDDSVDNARLNRLPDGRLRTVTARAEEALGRLSRARFDVVVLDPPRTGCSPDVIDPVFGGLAPRRAVYVSCNPVALVAELPSILAHGYAIDRVQPIDMFPHTDHIETVVTLSKRA